MKRHSRLMVLALSGAAIAVMGVLPVQAAHQNTFRTSFASATNRVSQPRFRWWWPGADVSFSELRREVNEIADAGFGGFEIADVYDSVSAKIDPKVYGWGTQRWNKAVSTVLDQAAKRHMTVDLTIGPHWPSVLPSITPQSPAAAHELVHGQAIVAGGADFSGKLPAPILPPSGTTAGNLHPQVVTKLVAVLAVQCVSSCKADVKDDPVALRAKSVIDLTDKVVGDTIKWTAPDEGSWILMPLYARTTGQIANMFDAASSAHDSPLTSPRSYAVDNFGKAGSDAVIAYWKQHLLTPQVAAGLKKVGGAIFEDSLELKALQFWTPGVLQAFKANRGYSVVPYLPVLLHKSLNSFITGPAKVAFTFDDVALMVKVRRDWNKTLAELWQKNHLVPLQAWASSMGMKYRNQGYGGPIDSILSAATTGQPEGESLAFGHKFGKFQALRAGRDMGNGGNLSDEMGAFFKAYETQWTADMLPTINFNFAYGINQLYIHGYAYNSAPGTQWPGFAPFGAMFSEAWNGKQPSWKHISDISAYLTRTEQVLQSGRNKTDVAVLRTVPDVENDADFLKKTTLSDAGYTVGYLSPAVLDLPSATVSGHRLNAQGPDFKVLVVPLNAHVSFKAAQKMEFLAKQGLPVVLFGTEKGAFDSAKTGALISTLSKLANVRYVSGEAGLPAAMKALKIAPDMQPAAASKLRSIHRAVSGGDIYYLFNDSKKTIREKVTLAGSGLPYDLSSWSGKVTPLAEYRVAPTGVTVPVALEPTQTAIIEVRHGTPALHAVASNASPMKVSKTTVVLRTEKSGTVGAQLSDGSTVSAVAKVAKPVTLSHWSLSVNAFTPGKTASETRHYRIRGIRLNKLVPWTEISKLKDVSGIGTYHTSFKLPASWAKANGAYLTFGGHSDTMRLWVNGHKVAVDQLSHKVDLGSYLKSGRNTLKAEITTPLNNAILKAEPQRFAHVPFGKRMPLACGLTGTVRIVPYTDVTIQR